MKAVDAAHGGDGWKPRVASHTEEFGSIWADCGVHYEWGQLEAVLLHAPGTEVEGLEDPATMLWTDHPNLGLARDQHAQLAEVYRENGVLVFEPAVDEAERTPNLIYMRDLFTMTPAGAILSRPAGAARAGEERIAARALATIGVPIVLSPYGTAVLEGPDILLAGPDLAFIGVGIRTNHEGAALAGRLLRDFGYEVVEIQTTFGCGHLDGVISILGPALAMIYPTRASYVLYDRLRHHGFRVAELPSAHEAQDGMAINLVPLDAETVVAPAGNPLTKRALEEAGTRCIEVDVSELMKGGGAVHCLTGVLKRGL